MPPETSEPQRIAILGLGLMGASLGLALRGLGWEVAGYDAAPGVAQRAVERGAVDSAAASVEEAVAGAELVVMAAPVLAMRDLLTSLAPALTADAVVTDLGSTKAQVTCWAAALLPHAERFVGGHPMTGSDRSGVDAGRADLYSGCLWCLTPTELTAPDATQRVAQLIVSLGAQVHLLDPQRHDQAVALISHLTVLAASALVLSVSSAPAWDDASLLAAGGWRDTTRVASGSPRMARDICLTNRAPLLAALDAYLAELHELRSLIAQGDESVEERFAAAKRDRDRQRDRG